MKTRKFKTVDGAIRYFFSNLPESVVRIAVTLSFCKAPHYGTNFSFKIVDEFGIVIVFSMLLSDTIALYFLSFLRGGFCNIEICD